MVPISSARSIEPAAQRFALDAYGPDVAIRRLTGRETRAGSFRADRQEAGRPVAVSPQFYVAFEVAE